LSEIIDERYRVLERLGAGSMGVVYLAEDIFLGRPVAIKVVDPSHKNDAQTIERFQKEARALAQIRHDNVVQVYAFGPHGQSFYFAMEYVAGKNLDDVIEELTSRQEVMEIPAAMKILAQIARGLGAVHARGLVHRDVKPGNIVIEEKTGRPVLVDFGLARARSSSNPKMSTVAGTPSYMAPEQATDPDGSKVTHRADIYAFACTAFELLTGQPVFDGDDVYEILVAHMKETPPAISSLRPELAAFDMAFNVALSKEPEARQESCEAFLAELESAARKAERSFKGSVEPKSMRRVVRIARVVVLADDNVARPIERQLDKLLRDQGIMPVCDRASSAADAFAACHASDVRLVILDDERTGEAAVDLVRQLGTIPRAVPVDVVAITRDLAAARASLAPLGVREILPKPLNSHVMASVLARIVDRWTAAPTSKSLP